MELSSILLWTVVFLAWLAYKKLSKASQFFEERGIHSEKPFLVFGNVFGSFSGKESLVGIVDRLYNKFGDEK